MLILNNSRILINKSQVTVIPYIAEPKEDLENLSLQELDKKIEKANKLLTDMKEGRI